VRGEGKEEGSASFLKKRSKKLLPMGFRLMRRRGVRCDTGTIGEDVLCRRATMPITDTAEQSVLHGAGMP
jgi:hypothetical protein